MEMDALEKWMIIQFKPVKPLQTTILSKWMFFQNGSSSNHPCLKMASAAFKHVPPTSSDDLPLPFCLILILHMYGPYFLGMSTFHFFVNKHFFLFCPLEIFFYFVLFLFLNSKKSKDSLIVY